MKNESPNPPLWRQHLMRALFLLIFIGLGPDQWSAIANPEAPFDPMTGVAVSFYAAFAFLCLFGVRYPLKFLPLLLIQLCYKTAWLLGTYRPAKAADLLDENMESWFWVMAVGIALDLLIIPWGYVYREYLKGFFQLRKSLSNS